MIDIKGYKIEKEIYNGSSTIIYKAVDEKNNKKVAIKLLKAEYPTPEELRDFKYEFDIAKSLSNVSGIINNFEMIDYRNTKAIIMEDFGAESIDKIIKTKKINLKSFLVIAIKAANILGEIHSKHIIHKDIKPQNILLNPETAEVKIIDFGISTQLNKVVQKIINPDHLEGTLAYISPEQTGRMNRSIDYRTDFYSLGVAFYEILTGKLPFESEDPMELVHAHIAKLPDPLHEVNNEIPKTVSDIVMKLLEKTAEKRYKSASGLKTDLEKCYNMLKEKGTIEEFEIAQNDISGKFQIPEKIYGREKEIDHLLDVFDHISEGKKEIVLFSGMSGIGKTVVINEVHKPMVEKRGYFVSGKHDQFKKSIPYTAIIQAFQDLIKQIITESDEKIAQWKNDILQAVGNNGKVITDVITSVEIIIGKQPDVQPLPPAEAQNRFNMVFQNFIKVFANREHPLVIFLDDLQWADSASLNLLEVLLTDIDLKYLLFIGAYRDNEVDASHPFTLMLNNIEKSGMNWEEVKLAPLQEKDITNLIADTLSCQQNDTKDFAKLVLSKTGGNPFFVTEFLKTLYDDNLIQFKDGWKWDLNKIGKTGITDNVIELMAKKINKLPEKTLAAMKVACCIGVKFYLDTLAVAYEKSEEETFEDLREAINEGLIIKIENDTKFVHDKVREATYSLISEKEQEEMHYKIGKILLTDPKYQQAKDRVFSIVNQLNLAKGLLNSEEKKNVIGLNFQAGIKAKDSAAYEAAVSFFRNGAELLDKDSWKTDYDLTLKFYTEWAEVEYITRDFEKAERLFKEVLSNAKNLLDKTKVYSLEIDFYNVQQKFIEAIKVGAKALKELGVRIPGNPGQLSIISELLKAKMAQGKRKVEDLIDLPEMTDPKKLAVVNIMMKLLPSAYIGLPNLFPLLVLKMVTLSIKYGNSPTSSYCYVLYGAALLAGVLGDINNGFQFGRFALKLSDKFNFKIIQGKTYLHYTWASHFKEPLKESLDYLLQSYKYSLEAGDFEYLGYFYLSYGFTYFFVGHDLNSVKKVFNDYSGGVKKLKSIAAENYFLPYKQAVYNLLGEGENTTLLKGEFYDEEQVLPTLYKDNSMSALNHYFVSKMILCFIYDDFKSGLKVASDGEEILTKSAIGMSIVQVFFFYYALMLADEIMKNKSDKKVYKKYYKKLLFIQKQFSKWGSENKFNYLNKYNLITAEILRINNKYDEAGKLYDESIKLAKENKFVQEEAIANECAAKFYLENEKEKIASIYLQDARYLYELWGCKPKVAQLDEKYPQLLAALRLGAGKVQGMNVGTVKATSKTTSTGGTTSAGLLDIGSVMKASQTISGEIQMSALLTKMIKILIENAGAQKGVLILKHDDDKLYIEAEGEVDKKDSTVLQSVPLEDSKNLSSKIVRLVNKTGEGVILVNACEDDTFSRDEYITGNKVLSVLCIPIVNQGKLIGILYLENNLSPGAFTESRVEMMKMLSSQASISIENARLIENMKEKERLKQEMEIAERIQTSLVPPAPAHDELDIAVAMSPAEEVGGDYYDVVFDDANNLWIAIGDVSGHGVTPGLIMMMAETAFNQYVMVNGPKGSPKDAIIKVNSILTENVRVRLKEKHFMTMSFLKYTGNGDFTYSGAHLDVVVYRAATKQCELLSTTQMGMFLGIKPDVSKITKEDTFKLEKDDIVVVYTDGVIESRHKDDRTKLLGMDILQDVIIQHGNQDANAVMEAISKAALEWCNHKPDDDITMVVMKKK